MKIAIIGPAHPLRGGGISTFNERLAVALQEQGHNVVIYSFSLQYPSFLFPGKTQFTDEPAPKNLTIRSAINSINPLNWLKVGKQLKNEKYDLIVVRYWIPFMGACLGFILRSVRKNNHTKIVCIADNVIPHEKRPGDRPLTEYFVKPVHAFIAMSKDVLEDLKQFTDKPSLFCAHPLYDNYGAPVSKVEACQKLSLKEDEKYILFFGFIRQYKGLDILLDAMADERIKDAGIKLIVAGEFYGERTPYDEQIAKNKIEDCVHLFTHFIPNDEIRYYFSAADLIVQPYRSATQSGITQVAYHFEKPMVVTNVGGLAEVIADNRTGYVTTPNAVEITEAILKFYNTGINNLEENLKEEKRKYSWDNLLESIFTLASK